MAAQQKKKRKSGSTGGASRSYAAAPKKRSRRKSGVPQIPAAAVTVGLVVANKDPILNAVNTMSIEGVKQSVRMAVTPDQIKKDVIYGAGGLVVGAAIKKFAPNFIKSPMGKLAKKIPKVF